MTISGWVGFDLDGTLATYAEGSDLTTIGAPVKLMVDKVKEYLKTGVTVKIFTARVSAVDVMFVVEQTKLIEAWCLEHIGVVLEVTNCKDFACFKIYDDRAVQVIMNKGVTVGVLGE